MGGVGVAAKGQNSLRKQEKPVNKEISSSKLREASLSLTLLTRFLVRDSDSAVVVFWSHWKFGINKVLTCISRFRHPTGKNFQFTGRLHVSSAIVSLLSSCD